MLCTLQLETQVLRTDDPKLELLELQHLKNIGESHLAGFVIVRGANRELLLVDPAVDVTMDNSC